MFCITVGAYFNLSFFLILFSFKTFSFPFSLCARLNGQLACQFSGANHA